MYNPTRLAIDNFITCLQDSYHHIYGSYNRAYTELIAWIGRMALEQIANSDALYHNVEHTIFVTLVGQEILRGKHIAQGGISPEEWLHFTIAALCHDVGYVKGVCRQDSAADGLYATGIGDRVVSLPPGATDASLTPHHVDRGKRFIQERFAGHELLDTNFIQTLIELTRFPVPAGELHRDTSDFPGLLRAADLIGQLGDPRYLHKISALFYEFEETGTNKTLGYEHPGDLRRGYPDFYWNVVFPLIQTALRHLEVTQQGQEIIASLNSQVFKVEHEAYKNWVWSRKMQLQVRATS
ncbi:MAG: metal-dependent phosphohydrolase [Cyanobacteriota bacterium]|nr:metal-dependent phosphohydrolase [Cyanobacteriota bacterium]